MAARGRDELVAALTRMDGAGYGAYRDLRGAWAFDAFTLLVDHVQADPFAAPSRLRVLLPRDTATFPPPLLTSAARRTGVAAHVARAFAAQARRLPSARGSGDSGAIDMEAPGQEVLPQTAVRIAADGQLEARFTVGLPARGRRVLGREAAALLSDTLPLLVEGSLRAAAHDGDALTLAADTNEDAQALRAALPGLGLVAFVADGAALPRRSGVDDRPLDGPSVVPFRSPDSLRVTIHLPNRGPTSGMGVPCGVTLVVGGGFHGKSTLLRALERGVYDHRPGDGRELVVSVASAVKVRAEDGRSVSGVDISPFIDHLPLGADTRAFTTERASGSTSQAAAVVEALEAGATTLLVDEDTAATNFMIRDRRMQELVPADAEPITPFVDRVRDLYAAHGVSTVIVLGGSGDYLDVADTVLSMRAYVAADVTARAREVAAAHPTGRVREAGRPLGAVPARVPLPASIDPRRGRKDVSVTVRGARTVLFGEQEIDLSAVEQVVSDAQARGVARGLALARERYIDGRRTLSQVLDAVLADVGGSAPDASDALDALDPRRPGDLAAFRRFELAAALNRLRTLEVAGARS